MSSPSRLWTGSPFWRRRSSTIRAIVDLPAPDIPVNQTTKVDSVESVIDWLSGHRAQRISSIWDIQVALGSLTPRCVPLQPRPLNASWKTTRRRCGPESMSSGSTGQFGDERIERSGGESTHAVDATAQAIGLARRGFAFLPQDCVLREQFRIVRLQLGDGSESPLKQYVTLFQERPFPPPRRQRSSQFEDVAASTHVAHQLHQFRDLEGCRPGLHFGADDRV